MLHKASPVRTTALQNSPTIYKSKETKCNTGALHRWDGTPSSHSTMNQAVSHMLPSDAGKLLIPINTAIYRAYTGL